MGTLSLLFMSQLVLHEPKNQSNRRKQVHVRQAFSKWNFESSGDSFWFLLVLRNTSTPTKVHNWSKLEIALKLANGSTPLCTVQCFVISLNTWDMFDFSRWSPDESCDSFSPPLEPKRLHRRTDARSKGDDINKFSRLDSSPKILTNGAPLERFVRWSSAMKFRQRISWQPLCF